MGVTAPEQPVDARAAAFLQRVAAERRLGLDRAQHALHASLGVERAV
jgi:hypothetical protein